MSQAATSSFQTCTRVGFSTSFSPKCSASMPGARTTTSSVRICGRTSAKRGSSRWVTKRPAASTTIQARSRSSPVSINCASDSATPAQDLMG